MEEEVWKDIPGFEGAYQVSSLGRVKSLERWVKHPVKDRIVRERLLSIFYRNQPGRGRYAHVCLRKDGRNITREVHRLMGLAFLGVSSGDGLQVRHLDGNPENNRLSNLALGTQSQNQLDLYDYRGYHHKLTPKDVIEIRRRLAEGETGRSLAKDFGVCESNISCIKCGHTYGWLQ